MIIESIRIKNWQIYQGEHRIDFAGKTGPYFIRAVYEGVPAQSNRAGKSAFVEAILYAFYGYHRFRLDTQLIFEGEKEMEVEVILKTDAGKTVRILRGRNQENEAKFEVTDAVGDGRQKFIDELLGMGLDDFLLTRCIMQDEIHAFTKLTPAEKQARFRQWLGITFWEKAEAVAKDDLSAIENHLTACDATISALEADPLNTPLESLESSRERLKAVNTALDTIRAKREEAQRSLAEYMAAKDAAAVSAKEKSRLELSIQMEEGRLPACVEAANKVKELEAKIEAARVKQESAKQGYAMLERKNRAKAVLASAETAVRRSREVAAKRAELQKEVSELTGLRAELERVTTVLMESQKQKEENRAVLCERQRVLGILRDFKGTCPVDSGKCPRDMAKAASDYDAEVTKRDQYNTYITLCINEFTATRDHLNARIAKLQVSERALQESSNVMSIEEAEKYYNDALADYNSIPEAPADAEKYFAEVNREITLLRMDAERAKAQTAPETVRALIESLRASLKALSVGNFVENPAFVATTNDSLSAYWASENELRIKRDEIMALEGKRERQHELFNRLREARLRRESLLAERSDAQFLAYIFGRNGIPSYQVENAFVEIENAANVRLQRLGVPFRLVLRAWRELSTLEPSCPVCGAKYEARATACGCGVQRKRKRKDEILMLVREGTREAEVDTDSGGGRTLLSFAIRLGVALYLLRRRGVEGCLLILDEIFGALDRVNTQALLSVIAEDRKFFPQIFVISHTDLVDSPPGSVLTVTRTGDRSRIEWEAA